MWALLLVPVALLLLYRWRVGHFSSIKLRHRQFEGGDFLYYSARDHVESAGTHFARMLELISQFPFVLRAY